MHRALECCLTRLHFLLCSSMQSNSAVAVAETVQHFITAMDSLKLNMVAVDQVSLKPVRGHHLGDTLSAFREIDVT